MLLVTESRISPGPKDQPGVNLPVIRAVLPTYKQYTLIGNAGVTVVGGCSMGALRASELDTYGMIGVGRIYRWYRDGVAESDDEVAVTFHPDTLEPLSVPLVNMRDNP